MSAIAIVHHDAELLVVLKPSGLATTSPDGGDCLATRVKALDPDAPRLHPTSRLDAEVSGLVTFARTPRATEALLEARRAHAYGRLYLALATHAPDDDAGRWDFPIGVDARDRRRRRVAPDDAEAKPSSTRFEVRARGELALLALYPETGRTHQLRVHCAHVGSPLFGDVIYGGERRVTRANGRVVSARRVMLHCAELDLPNVAGEGRLHLVAPLPDDFARTCTAVGLAV
ncbi:MAG: RluA family pseudouridine synthase [Sandaracinus sp.]|nr:RluA family pseudouridine synthase [Sandaracinus sp.]